MILITFEGQMVSTTGYYDLHAFAQGLGLPRKRFQPSLFGNDFGCYILTTKHMRQKAFSMGARMVKPDLLKRLVRQGKQERPARR